MNLSKASDMIHYDNLMIARLGTYGFPLDVFQYMRNYLTNRQQRVRVKSNFNTWENIIAGVPQGSIFGILLFNIFISDPFLFVSNSHLSTYVDGKHFTCLGYNLEEIKNLLRFDFGLISKWFEERYMVLNTDKCHFIIHGKDRENETFIFNNFIFNNSNEEKTLGITSYWQQR